MLTDAIAAHLATWETPPYVELAAFGTADPTAIARVIDDACDGALGARVVAARFYQSSIGAVAGVELADGRAIVVKVHQPTVAIETLHELALVRAIVPYSPRVLGAPFAIGRGAHATFEALVTGDAADIREPVIRAALARGLHAIVRSAQPLVASSALAPTMVWQSVWGTPHSKLFDFAATADGAEWIDEVARAARAQAMPAGERVIAHCDWRIEHVRFAGIEPIVAYDWDSLRCDHEPAIVGWIAHAFAADWSTDRPPAPTLDDARAFVAAYETARGHGFDPLERRLCGAAFAYGCAYTARCGHALGVDERDVPGTFHELVARHGTRLMTL